MTKKKPKVCPLISLTDTTDIEKRRTCQLSFAVQDVDGLVISDRVVKKKLLSCLREIIKKIDFNKNIRSFDRQLAPKNPYLTETQLQKLDENGIIREGEIVHEKDVLVSIVRRWISVTSDRPEHDDSEYATAEDDGTIVKQVYYREALASSHKNLRESVSIQLVEEHPLQIGDVLVCNSRVLGQINEIRDLSKMPVDKDSHLVDLLISASQARRVALRPSSRTITVGKLSLCVNGSCRSTAVTARSLISYQPLQGKYGAAQSLTADQAYWLYSRKMFSNLFELTTLKSDDIANLPTLQPDNQSIPTHGKPASLEILKAHLLGLGLRIESRIVGSVPSLILMPANDQEQIALSSGVVVRPETINYRTYKPEPGGIFCETIFGPEKQRSNRLGHIQLVYPIIPMIFRLGKRSILQQLLGLPKKLVEEIIHWKKRAIETAGSVDFIPISAMLPSGAVDHGTGAAAISYLLSNHVKGTPIANWKNRVGALVQKVILVIPPEQRPLVLLDSGNFATSDLNDHYRRIINRNSRLAKLMQLNAPQPIIDNEARMLQETVDCLHANQWVSKKVRCNSEGTKRPLKDLLTWLLEQLERPFKTVDWSGRGRMKIVPSLSAKAVVIPSSIYHKLRLDDSQPILITTNTKSPAFIAAIPQRHEEHFIGISPEGAARLNLSTESLNKLYLHRPLSDAACNEARQLIEDVPQEQHYTNDEDTTFFGDTDRENRLRRLVDQISSGEELVMRSARALLHGSCVSNVDAASLQ